MATEIQLLFIKMLRLLYCIRVVILTAFFSPLQAGRKRHRSTSIPDYSAFFSPLGGSAWM